MLWCPKKFPIQNVLQIIIIVETMGLLDPLNGNSTTQQGASVKIIGSGILKIEIVYTFVGHPLFLNKLVEIRNKLKQCSSYA